MGAAGGDRKDKYREYIITENERYKEEVLSGQREEIKDRFPEIMEQIRRDGVWDGGRPLNISVKEMRVALSEVEKNSKIIEKKLRKRKRKRQAIAVVAIIVLGMLGMSISGDAHRSKILKMLKEIVGETMDISITNSENTLNHTQAEEKAFEEISDRIGVGVPRLRYRFEGMEYEKHVINEDRKSASIFYKRGEDTITFAIYGAGESVSTNIEGETIEVIYNEYIDADIEIIEMHDKSYVATFKYDNVSYMFSGSGDFIEFKKVAVGIVM